MCNENKYYSDEIVSSFIERFGFPADQRCQWHQRLEKGAQYYWEAYEDSGLSIDVTKSALLRLVAAVQEVNDAVKAVDGDTWCFLADQSQLLRGGYDRPYLRFEPMTEDPDFTDVETVTYQHRQIGSDTQCIEQREYVFATLLKLDLIATIAEDVGSTHFATKRGPKPNWPLRHWASEMTWFWGRYTQTKPTFDAQNGQAVSPASVFCVEAFKQVDPRIPDTQILTAMRAAMDRAPLGGVSSPQSFSGNPLVSLLTDSHD
jgi:hypothetical protein